MYWQGELLDSVLSEVFLEVLPQALQVFLPGQLLQIFLATLTMVPTIWTRQVTTWALKLTPPTQAPLLLPALISGEVPMEDPLMAVQAAHSGMIIPLVLIMYMPTFIILRTIL